MMYPDWRKKTLELREMRNIRHYKMRVAGDDLRCAGCVCRGCEVFRNRGNRHVAEPFRSILNVAARIAA